MHTKSICILISVIVNLLILLLYFCWKKWEFQNFFYYFLCPIFIKYQWKWNVVFFLNYAWPFHLVTIKKKFFFVFKAVTFFIDKNMNQVFKSKSGLLVHWIEYVCQQKILRLMLFSTFFSLNKALSLLLQEPSFLMLATLS